MGRGSPSAREPVVPDGPGYWVKLKDVSLASFEARLRPRAVQPQTACAACCRFPGSAQQCRPHAPPEFVSPTRATVADAPAASQAKQRVPVILANGLQLLLWKLEGELFCSAVNSTAFQYPLLDAELVEPVPAGATGPVVRSKLDGTTYQLRDGKVLEWCPKEESALSLRNLFAGLKTNAPPVPLPVYAVKTAAKTGEIEVFIPVVA